MQWLMRLHSIAGAAALVLATQSPGLAEVQANDRLTDKVTLQGECGGALVLYGESLPESACKPAVATRFQSKRTLLRFSTDTTTLVFVSEGGYSKLDKNTIQQTIHQVLVTTTNTPKTGDGNNAAEPLPSTAELTANGNCTISNWERGIPSQWRCEAISSTGRFAAVFDHDGSKPEVELERGRPPQ